MNWFTRECPFLGCKPGASERNSQSEADTDELRRHAQYSQTPPLRSEVVSDADDETEEHREEETSGTLWGHPRLPRSVYDNNAAVADKRKSKTNAVWDVVKHLKEHTVDGVVEDTKYTHVCVSPITTTDAGDVGADIESDGNSLWFCNKLFSLSKTKSDQSGHEVLWLLSWGRGLDWSPYLKDRV